MMNDKPIALQQLEETLYLNRAELAEIDEQIEGMERRRIVLKEQVIATRSAIDGYRMGYNYAQEEFEKETLKQPSDEAKKAGDYFTGQDTPEDTLEDIPPEVHEANIDDPPEEKG